ncbi:MAG: carboxypeptidase regulatory-like domain-containing protein [Rikenellaceae bacterium]|nr:carboxypeptidase regulatory-like domain-containing protein [Rikenellaceae bacterium]MBR2628367.1 carboxypeptidase regulatory-like domain-containing protein [Alistipes sp.]
MKKIQILLCVVTALAFSACSKDIIPTTGNISGTIYDAVTGLPISNASVTLFPIGNSVTTSSDGYYEFLDITADKYTIQCSKEGYSSRNQAIAIYANSNNLCDIHLEKASFISGITLSTNTLNFGANESEKGFSISNIGNSGEISWSISAVTVPWLTVDPMFGSIAQGQQGSVKVIIDRSYITTDQTTYLTINAGGGSMQLAIYVNSDKGDGGDNEGGSDEGDGNDGNEGSGGQVEEDYSSAKININTDEFSFKITKCKRSGNIVKMEYLLTNNTFSDMQWDTGTAVCYASDDLFNSYSWELLAFTISTKNGGYGSTIYDAPIAGGQTVRGSISLKDVDPSAQKISFYLTFFVSGINTPSQKVNMIDIPIY